MTLKYEVYKIIYDLFKDLEARFSTAVLSNLRLYISQEHIHLDAVDQKLYYMLVLTV